MFKNNRIYKTRSGDIVRVEASNSNLYDAYMIHAISEIGKEFVKARGSGMFNFWSKSGSRTNNTISYKDLCLHENLQNNFDVLPEEVSEKEYPEYYI